MLHKKLLEFSTFQQTELQFDIFRYIFEKEKQSKSNNE